MDNFRKFRAFILEADVDADQNPKSPVAPKAPEKEPKEVDNEIEQDAEEDDPSEKTNYSSDDFREILNYVYEILDQEDEEDKGGQNDTSSQIGIDLLIEYADGIPQQIINNMVADLKEIFDIEDEFIDDTDDEPVSEGFVKQKKGSAAKLTRKKARLRYKKNRAKLKMKAKKWRKTSGAKRAMKLHKKLFKRLGKKPGMRLVAKKH